MTKRKIIVAPLNWGLGHAARCIPIIHFLLAHNYMPIIASNGEALAFLQKEFPEIESVELPSYNISYRKNLKFGLLLQIPNVLKAIREEKKCIDSLLAADKEIVGIIADNRFGVRSKLVPSVYITHQVNVLSGVFTKISSSIHQNIIKKFDECWVPDTNDSQFSGKLSKAKSNELNLKYIGVLSRFKKEQLPIVNDVLILLSGVNSQRKALEEQLMNAFKGYQGKVVLVQGKIEKQQKESLVNGIKIYNYLLSAQLEKEINQSAVIVCRSGYSSIMDLAFLQKKAFFIPTPYQTEQEYLATHLEKEKMIPFSKEEDFSIEQLVKITSYKGLEYISTGLEKELLSLFERK